MTVFAQGSTYNAATHRMKIALWIARRHRPFSIVEDPELLDIFRDLNSRVVTPSASTVSRDVKELFLLSRNTVGQRLQAYPGKLHLIVDGWTSPQVISFLGSCIAMISDGKLAVIILDFIKYVSVFCILSLLLQGSYSRASRAHTGVYLAGRIAQCLHEYGIEDRVSSSTFFIPCCCL